MKFQNTIFIFFLCLGLGYSYDYAWSFSNDLYNFTNNNDANGLPTLKIGYR